MIEKQNSDICNRLQDSEPVCDRYERALREVRARLAAHSKNSVVIYGAPMAIETECLAIIDQALGEVPER